MFDFCLAGKFQKTNLVNFWPEVVAGGRKSPSPNWVWTKARIILENQQMNKK